MAIALQRYSINPVLLRQEKRWDIHFVDSTSTIIVK